MNRARVKARASTLSFLVAVLCTAATDAAEELPQATLAGSLRGSASGPGFGIGLDGRLHFSGGSQLGLGVAADWLDVEYLGGLPASGVLSSEATLFGLLPFFRAAELELDLRLSTGLRYLWDRGERTTAYAHALRAVTELGCLAHVRLDRRHLLRGGVLLAFELETTPTTAVADQMQLLTLGVGRALMRNLALQVNVDAGGSYGFDGDNGKAVVRGSLTLRAAFGGDALTAF